MTGNKKGNVDTDIVFTIMQKLVEKDNLGGIILVSGDGDYFRMVEYLVEKGWFTKLLAPSGQSMSSLYRQNMDRKYYEFLDVPGIRKKIGRTKNRHQKSGFSLGISPFGPATSGCFYYSMHE